MGKIRKEYREERMEVYGYTSQTSDSSQTSGSSESSTSDSESGSSTERKRKHIRKKSKYKREKKKRSESEDEAEYIESKYKREKKKRSESEDEAEYIEREKRKRRKHAKHKDTDEMSEEEEEYIRVEERKHRSRKHKHHHRKHKHKHRRHRHHRSEEEYQERRRGASAERGDSRKEKEEWEERKYDKVEKDRRNDKEFDGKNRKEEKRYKERGDSRQVKSKWDDDEDVQYNTNKRIKPDPDADDSRGETTVKQEGDRNRKRRDREEATQNGRPNWGTGEIAAQNVKQENTPENKDQEVQRPTMALSGKLAEDSNTFNGVVIKYSQPPEARKPKRRWRWYIFKGEEDLPFLPLHRQSAYLIGRDRKVADIPTDHPSCSKQHAVLQYRLVTYQREDGTKGRTVKPYILDLESANGTYVNNRRVESRRFVELIEKDVVKFGYSSREYILLHEGSKGDDADAPDMGVDVSPVTLLRS